MAIIIKQVIVKPGLWGLTKRDLRDAGRVAIKAAGDYWHRQFKKNHFQAFAAAKYGYKRRTWRYEERKMREHPESQGRPLVFTGESERRAMASDTVNATAKSYSAFRAECVINANTLNYRQLADEVTRTTTAEDARLQNEFATVFTREFMAIANTKTGTASAAGAA